MNEVDAAMKRAAKLFATSEMTLEDLGQAMGYGRDIARKAAWQFLNKTSDPRISMLRRFAKAMKVSIKDLV